MVHSSLAPTVDAPAPGVSGQDAHSVFAEPARAAAAPLASGSGASASASADSGGSQNFSQPRAPDRGPSPAASTAAVLPVPVAVAGPSAVPEVSLVDESWDPISLVEAHAEAGTAHGAVKVVPTPALWARMGRWYAWGPAPPPFAVAKQPLGGASALGGRAWFYSELAKFHRRTPNAADPVAQPPATPADQPPPSSQLTPIATPVVKPEPESGAEPPETPTSQISPAAPPALDAAHSLYIAADDALSAGQKPVDVYQLWVSVGLFGGFAEVEVARSWQLVAQDVGYAPSVAPAVAPVLSKVYGALLYPFEKHLAGPHFNDQGKRLREHDVGSVAARGFRRSVRAKLAKGFVPSILFDIDISSSPAPQAPPAGSGTSADAGGEQAKISTQAQLNHSIHNLLQNRQIDDISVGSTGDLHTVMSYEDLRTRDAKFRAQATKIPGLSSIDDGYWQFVASQEASRFLPGQSAAKSVISPVSVRIGDGLVGAKTNPGSSDSDDGFIRQSLHPWNINNVSVAPNSLLAALSESDVSSDTFTDSFVSIESTYSTENWTCEDHFTQKIDVLCEGSPKKWLFIPESEFDKFEALVDQLSQNTSSNEAAEISSFLQSNSGSDADSFMDSIGNSLTADESLRLRHSNETFQNLIEYQRSRLAKKPKNLVISPDVLTLHGIKYSTTVQYPGEFVVKYPKTYSFSYSLGLNVSQHTNFASPLWLKYAVESEKWLQRQNIIPNFSVFKLMVNLIQLYDAGQTSKIKFDAKVYEKVAQVYGTLSQEEIDLRTSIRSEVGIKELILDEKVFTAVDAVTDDDLSNAFPSKIQLTHTSTKRTFTISLHNYLKYLELNDQEKDSADRTIPQLKSSEFKAELHLYYSDERLRSMYKSVMCYVSNYSSWIETYEELMSENADHALKTYKNLLIDGEKIYSAICSPYYLELFNEKHSSVAEEEQLQINKFKFYIINLRKFIENANWYVEECQNILAIKHQQRIRNTDDTQNVKYDDLLPRLLTVLDKIPTLNFSCFETEQILEFKNEIENFDVACRTFVTKSRQTMQEINDLINLGKSFGTDLKSLQYIIRMKNRLKWIENYEIIIKGGDPFNDRKHRRQVFSLSDLEEFYELGLANLGTEDVPKIEVIDSMIKNSYMYNSKILSFLESQDIDSIKIEDVDILIDETETKFKLKSKDRIFINLERLDDLYDFRSALEVLWKFFSFRDRIRKRSNPETFDFHEIKSLKEELVVAKLPIKEAHLKFLDNQLKKTTNFIKSCENLLNGKIITTVLYSGIYPLRQDTEKKLTVSESLITTLQRLIQKCEISFAIEGDSFVNSCSYKEKNVSSDAVQNDDYLQTYCVCREAELGTMIECDSCKEWFHSGCVASKFAEPPALKEDKAKSKSKKETKVKPEPKGENPKNGDVDVSLKKEQTNELQDEPVAVNIPVAKIKQEESNGTKKANGISEDGDDAYICPICQLIDSEFESDAHVSSSVSDLKLISLTEDAKKLSVYPPNELKKLIELNNIVCRCSQYVSVQIVRIKESDESVEQKLDKLIFLLRKVYGAAILLEDLYFELITTIKRLAGLKQLDYRQHYLVSVPVANSAPVAKPTGPDADYDVSNGNETSIEEPQTQRSVDLVPTSYQNEDTESGESKVSTPAPDHLHFTPDEVLSRPQDVKDSVTEYTSLQPPVMSLGQSVLSDSLANSVTSNSKVNSELGIDDLVRDPDSSDNSIGSILSKANGHANGHAKTDHEVLQPVVEAQQSADASSSETVPEPAEPVPVKLVPENVEPSVPAVPVKAEVVPVETVKPVEPVKAVEPVRPVESDKSVESVKPVEPVKAAEPIKPVEPVKPVDTVEPIEPAVAVAPAATTAEPVVAAAPVQPAHPEPAEPKPSEPKPAEPAFAELAEALAPVAQSLASTTEAPVTEAAPAKPQDGPLFTSPEVSTVAPPLTTPTVAPMAKPTATEPKSVEVLVEPAANGNEKHTDTNQPQRSAAQSLVAIANQRPEPLQSPEAELLKLLEASSQPSLS